MDDSLNSVALATCVRSCAAASLIAGLLAAHVGQIERRNAVDAVVNPRHPTTPGATAGGADRRCARVNRWVRCTGCRSRSKDTHATAGMRDVRGSPSHRLGSRAGR